MGFTRRSLVLAGPFLLQGCAGLPAATPEQRHAFAPTGTLRVGVNSGSPLSFVRDASGSPRGVLHDLTRELGTRLGVPVEYVEFRSVPDLVAAVKSGQVDLTGTNATPARAADIEFARTLIEMELGYLVAGASSLRTADDAMRPGLKIGVAQGSTSQSVLPRMLPQATIVPVPGLGAVAERLRSGAIDAFTTNKPALFEIGDTVPGSRVLPGGWGKEQWAMGFAKGRAAAVPHLESFLALARDRGWVKAAMDRAGLRGAAVV
jgi:polar amino acid transport system substrate-binding protein